jgi:hypothetical protein
VRNLNSKQATSFAIPDWHETNARLNTDLLRSDVLAWTVQLDPGSLPLSSQRLFEIGTEKHMATEPEPKPPIIKSVALAAAFFLLVLLIANFLPQLTRSRAETWLANVENETSAALTFGPHLKDPHVSHRLLSQAATLGSRAEFHKAVMLYFLSNYYSAIVLAAVCGGIAAATLVLISKKGWSEANSYAVATFLTASACATFFLAMPALLAGGKRVQEQTALSEVCEPAARNAHSCLVRSHLPDECAWADEFYRPTSMGKWRRPMTSRWRSTRRSFQLSRTSQQTQNKLWRC